MRAPASLLVVASLGLALTAPAQEAATPATPESTAPTSRDAADTAVAGEPLRGSAGTLLDGVAIPPGVVGVIE